MQQKPRVSSKADMLIWLKPRLQKSRVLDLYVFTVQQWTQQEVDILLNIKQRLHYQTLIVRSSAEDEDQSILSKAGYYRSESHISADNNNDLYGAIQRVIASYKTPANHQVLVQPQLLDANISGVISSHVVATGQPYYTLSYEQSARTDGVTSGTGSEKTLFIRRGSSHLPAQKWIADLMAAVAEIEELLDLQALQIEFAYTQGANVIIFQVRPLTSVKQPVQGIDPDILTGLKKAMDAGFDDGQSDTLKMPRVLGLMPDWNPAELLGDHPRPMAVSLFRALISSSIWCHARAGFGYKNIGTQDFLRVIAGKPYVDVRKSFSSFLPAGLPDKTEQALLNAWMNRLIDNPGYHDQVEFNIVQTCIDFNFHDDHQQRYQYVLNGQEKNLYFSALQAVTQQILLFPGATIVAGQQLALDRLPELNLWQQSEYSVADFKTLLNNALIWGAKPFAKVARQAFVAESLLRSMQQLGVLSVSRVWQFRNGLHSVSNEFLNDRFKLAKGQFSHDDFIRRYGHLRPGSFDITSLCYHEHDWVKYVAANEAEYKNDGFMQPSLMAGFRLSGIEENALDRLLKQYDYGQFSPDAFMRWLAAAINWREQSKLYFSAFISRLLEFIAAWGHDLGFSRDDLSYLSLDDIEGALSEQDNEATLEHLAAKINGSKWQYQQEKSVLLNELLCHKTDINYFWHQDHEAHFIGTGITEANVCYVDHQTPPNTKLSNCIVLVKYADPGYDWIFTQKIAGFLTAYGGPNSHMAVRSAEFNIPAALGCGELLFEQLKSVSRLGIDCSQKRFFLPEEKMTTLKLNTSIYSVV